MRVGLLVLLLGFAAATAARAQAPTVRPDFPSFAPPELHPGTLAPAAPSAWEEDAAQQRRARRGQPGTVFLIVGGAIAVAGIVADEGILIVGGVVVAGYGLYLNLR